MKAHEWILTVPWYMTTPALDAMYALAQRAEIDTETVKAAMHGPLSLALRDGQRRDDTAGMVMRDGVAVITIDGPIYRYASFFTSYSGGITTDQLAKDFQRALADVTVQAILLVLDSPGGEATGINELSDAIYAARGTKPIGAYAEGYCASAAYYLASACDWLWCDDNAWIGSIGTILGLPDPAQRKAQNITFVSSQSPKKHLDPTSAAGQESYQAKADAMTEVFIERVMRNRGLDRAAVVATEGDVLIGQQAIDAGLADALGSEEGAIVRLREQASAMRRPATRTHYMEASAMNWSEFWKGMFDASASAEGAPLQAAIELAAVQQQPAPAAADPRIAELQQQLAAMRTQAIEARAESFVASLVASSRALPAESAELTALYVQAAQDDARDNRGRVARLEAVYSARAPHQLTQELVPEQHTALSLDRAPRDSASSVQALMQMTPLGRRALTKSA